MSTPAPSPSLARSRQALIAAWDARELDATPLQAAVEEAAGLLAEPEGPDGLEQHVAGLVRLGRAYGFLLVAEFARATAEARAAEERLARAGDETRRAWAEVVQGISLYYQAEYNASLAAAEAGLARFERLGDRRGQAGALAAIGNTTRVNGDPGRALHCTRRALELAQACGHAPTEAVVLNNLGTVAHSLGDFAQSAAYFERALTLARRIGHRRVEMFALNNIGTACEGAGDVQAAYEWHRQSLALKETSGDRRGRGISLNNLGITLKKMGRREEALEHQQRALALFLEIDDRWGQGYCHQEFGDLALARGDQAEARRQFERALALRRGLGDRLLEAEAINTLAGALLEPAPSGEDLARARELATSALAIGQETGATPVQLNARKLLHRIAKLEGDTAAALAECEHAMELERLSFSRDAEQRLKNLRVLHEVEVAQRQLQAEQDRSRELQTALEQAEQHRRHAVEADHYKSEIMRIVAHDLRSPVGAMRSLGELVAARHRGDAETQELCAMLTTSADAVLAMVRNILDAGALEEGRLTPRLRPLDLRPMLEELGRTHTPQAHAKQQRVEVRLEGGLTTTGDERLLATAVGNVLSNALKYSPLGQTVWLEARRRAAAAGSDGREEIVVAVRDEGPGLTEEDRTNLFGRFTRLSAKPTAGEPSTGLGLFIVRQLVTLHGGRVWAESAGPGRGATFFIALPTGPDASAAPG